VIERLAHVIAFSSTRRWQRRQRQALLTGQIPVLHRSLDAGERGLEQAINRVIVGRNAVFAPCPGIPPPEHGLPATPGNSRESC
jgi:hypothetical protein